MLSLRSLPSVRPFWKNTGFPVMDIGSVVHGKSKLRIWHMEVSDEGFGLGPATVAASASVPGGFSSASERMDKRGLG